ncbi:hypothetical protein RAD16_22995 [Bradyrhizobium sp. 18BD]
MGGPVARTKLGPIAPLPALLRTNVQIVHKTSPDRIDIAIAASESLHESGRVAGHFDQLNRRRIAEPLRPVGKPVGLDGTVQEFRREDVSIRITPA